MTLCERHQRDWLEALDIRANHRPVLVQIGGEGGTLRHALDARKARLRRWQDEVRHAQALAVAQCGKGAGCTKAGQEALW